MKKSILIVISLFVMVCSAQARVKPAQDLARLLQSFLAEQEIHPDSIYPNILQMEQRCTACTDPTERAVTEAVLGCLYAENKPWTQSRKYKTQSDSNNMDEWSEADFDSVATLHFRRALADMDLLHRARIKDWAPLLWMGKDDGIFDNDMLLPLYRAARQRVNHHEALPPYAQLIQYYQQQDNRRAALWLSLDSVGSNWKDRKQALLQLRDEYSDLDLCAEVYSALSDAADTDSARYAWAQEGVKRYPKYDRRATLENQMLSASSPVMNCHGESEMVYPYQPMTLALSCRNITSIRCTLYSVPTDYEHDPYANSLQRQGTLKRSWSMSLADHPIWQTWQDTLRFTLPDTGHYILRIEPQTQAKAQGQAEPVDLEFRVSEFSLAHIQLPTGQVRYIVTDALSGKPQPMVTVRVDEMDRDDRDKVVSTRTFYTDERGIVDCTQEERKSYKVHIERLGDKDFADQRVRIYRYNTSRDEEESHTRLFTDRGIYRPGQTVHVSGLTYRQKHWELATASDHTVILTLRDASYKVIARDTLQTDDSGTFAHEFQLPTEGKLGRFTIAANGVSRNIRVEEYRRPTFEVVMDEVPALQLPADSITLTGVARSYAGVPLRGVRVTNQVRWGFPFWGWRSMDLPDEVQLDTVQTDDEGRFSVRIPLTLTQQQWRWGRRLTLTSTVTNDAGESHEGQQSVCLSTSLHMSADVPELYDRDRKKPWTAALYSATGKEVPGTITVTLKQGDQTVLQVEKPSGKMTMDELATIPSGAYTAHLMGIAGNDTARVERRVVIFSPSDTRLPIDTVWWTYNVRPEFTETTPARIQVGSSVTDAYVYLLLMKQDQVVRDTLMQFSDSLLTLDIPYEQRYGDGLCLQLYMVRDGKSHQLDATISLAKPDKRLTHRWVTFRDRLQPGQQETWTLQVNRPDGTPASANLMVAMYDASLDALQSHQWSFSPTLNSHIYHSRLNVVTHPALWGGWSFPLRMKNARGYDFSTLNDDLFQASMRLETVSFGGGRRLYKTAAYANDRVGAVMSAKAVQGDVYEVAAVDMAEEKMSDRIAGLDVSNDNAEPSDEPDLAVPVRENFAETALFMPQLRTDAEGRVGITFTLPESLTTWHLWALTHTQDVCSEVWDEQIVAQKDLMAQLLLPRFLRPSDEATLTATVTNISDQAQTGRAMLRLLDAETEKVILTQSVRIDIPAHRDSVFQFPWTVPAQYDRVIVRWMVEGQTCSDGEQRLLPILPAEEWITTTRAITGYGIGVSQVDLKGIFPDSCSHRLLTIEYTTHPEQIALQALPALTRTDRQDAFSLAAALYATRLGQHLDVEVPDSADIYLQRLTQLQRPNGSLTWYPCDLSTGNVYVTREVCTLLTRLLVLTGSTGADDLYQKALGYLLSETHKQIADWKHRDYTPSVLYGSHLDLLYIVLYSGQKLTKEQQKDVDYLLSLLRKSTDEYGLEDQALAAIVLQQAGESRRARKCVNEFRRRLVTTPDRGTYIEWRKGSFTSIDRKIAIHVQMMEALQRVCPDSTQLLGTMRRYLLQQKRTQQWDTPVNSASAIFALCNVEREPAAPARDVLTLKNSRGRTLANFIPADDTLGYVCDSIVYTRITTPVEEPATLRLQKISKGESWGAAYALYRQPIALVQGASEGLSLRVEFPSQTTSGSRIVARYVLTADRDYEFVDLSVPRPAALEPVSQRSGYRWQGGLGYYQEMRDNRTDYHFESMPRGTYVIEEEFFVERRGSYSAGIPTLRCTYAEEFQSHSPNQIIQVR